MLQTIIDKILDNPKDGEVIINGGDFLVLHKLYTDVIMYWNSYVGMISGNSLLNNKEIAGLKKIIDEHANSLTLFFVSYCDLMVSDNMIYIKKEKMLKFYSNVIVYVSTMIQLIGVVTKIIAENGDQCRHALIYGNTLLKQIIKFIGA